MRPTRSLALRARRALRCVMAHRHAGGGLAALLAAPAALAITPAAEEYIRILRELQPVYCEKLQLRRSMALAKAEQREQDYRTAEKRFAALSKDPATDRRERRLAELETRISDGRGGTRDPTDLEAISLERRKAFYSCPE